MAADALVWVVAGCLFEVSLPIAEPSPWRWSGPRPEVTLLHDGARAGAHHFRFRAEAAGATAGATELHFRGGGDRASTVTVRIAAERWPGP